MSCVVAALHVQTWQRPINICTGKESEGLDVAIVDDGSECARGVEALLDLLVVVLRGRADSADAITHAT